MCRNARRPALSAQELPAGKVRSITTIGFQYTLGDLGLDLRSSQHSRLATYRLNVF
jgi:hypothetical protein